MNGGCRTWAAAVSKVVVEETRPAMVKEGSTEEPMVVLDESHLESEVAKIRGRWELASVLNFLGVFEPVIGSGLKLSAEEIEMGLIKPNSSLAQLHLALLKILFAVIFTFARMGGGPYLMYVTLVANNPFLIKAMALGLQLVSAFWFYKIVAMVRYKLTKRTRTKVA